MTGIGNFARELGEEFVDRERRSKIRAAQKTVSSMGELECVDCGFDIPRERRIAAPFAKRCITCQEIYELECS